MTSNTPKFLTIEHLRGSVQPFTVPFEKGKKLTVIYGENGTGKSTICDALDFIGEGKVGSLDGRGLGKTNQFWPSIGKKPSEVSVTYESSNGHCKAVLSNSSVVVTPLERRPIVQVLRRSQILSLIDAKPAERYTAISRFIDVSGIESSETYLKDLIRQIENSRDKAVAIVHENSEAIKRQWEIAGKPTKDAIEWAKAESKKDVSHVLKEAGDLDVLCQEFDRLLQYPQKYQSAKLKVENALKASNEAQASLDVCIKESGEDISGILEILEAAKRHFSNHPNQDVCPLCESSENAKGLQTKINEKLSSHSNLKKLQAAQASKKNKDKELEVSKVQLQTVQDEGLKQGQKYEECISRTHWPSDVKLPSAVAPAEIEKWDDSIKDNSGIINACKKLAAEKRDTGKFYQTLKQALIKYNDNVKVQKDLDVLMPRLKKLHELVVKERREYTDKILSGIATEVGRLYEKVHPGEGLNKISLELDANKRASLEIGASFASLSNTKPQAYFSDSHLDTLGLCIFLALSGKEMASEKFLVLDDVLASMDEPHVERLIHMLHDEIEKFKHGIITTHYRPWKEKLRWGWLQNGQCQFLELAKWTSQQGMTLIKSIPDTNRLKELINEVPPDPQLVCAKAGYILEAALLFIAGLYECKLPYRASTKYTIGELLPAIDKKLRAALKIDQLENAEAATPPVYKTILLGVMMDEIERVCQARNVFGCHFNELSFELLESDAILFGQQVLTLMVALVDQENGWPRNSKSGSYWATAGETRRLHPLQKPS